MLFSAKLVLRVSVLLFALDTDMAGTTDQRVASSKWPSNNIGKAIRVVLIQNRRTMV